MLRQANYVAGVWYNEGDKNFTSINPATQEVIWQGPIATAKQVDLAVIAAKQAQIEWGKKALSERIAILNNFQDLLAVKREELAVTISEENGKPLWEADAEAGAVIGKIKVSITAHNERCSETHNATAMGQQVVRYRPHGVVAVFGPFNFPAHLPNGHIVPALLAGNAVVFKPSELTPKVGELLVSLLVEAGIPAGVINLVQGGVDVGKALASHPAIDGIFFTGSAKTGISFHQQLAGQPEKILALEMGGNNPLVVWNAKDMLAASYYIVQSAFVTSGQRCTCARRLIIEDNAAGDELINALLKTIDKITIGPGNASPQPFMGPLISNNAKENILRFQKQLLKNKAEIILEAKELQSGLPFLSCGVIDVTASNKAIDEEAFGPLLQVKRVKTFDDAIIAANNTCFGLSAGLISDEEQLYRQFWHQVRAGIVNWNQPTTGASSSAPFGGVGHSGNHRPSAYLACDYCSYPVAGIEQEVLKMPENLTPGINFNEEIS